MNMIVVLAIVAGVLWLGLMMVSALRNRGGEEIAPNLKPGINDQELETRRLEKGQKVAIIGSAFLAISLPLYFLGEQNRQEGFVEEFAHDSELRGEHLVEEFACFSCHGPLGVGGVAPFVEPRSGVSVDWAAPALDDVLYRFDEDELNFWITFGRGNTPMPAWGLPGGGPLNENQVVDVINYLRTIQVSQQEAVDRTVGMLATQEIRLVSGDATMASTIVDQEQILAEIDQAPADSDFIGPLSEEARSILEDAEEGIDTDGDGLSDTSEVELSAISEESAEYFREVDAISLDPNTPDAEIIDEFLAALDAASGKDPILGSYADAIRSTVENQEEGEDTDGDGLTDATEASVSGQSIEASASTIPSGIETISLDPSNPESSGEPDHATANRMVGGLGSVAISTNVADENSVKLKDQEGAGLEFLLDADAEKAWEIDVAGVAASMETSEDDATRAVTLFNAHCARCHTASFSAGSPFTLEAGSGGFGPALWDGRPIVQFGEAPTSAEETDLLVEFIIKGSEAEKPYGLNGFGSGRMPAFGAILSMDDIDLLAQYLRGSNLDGVVE